MCDSSKAALRTNTPVKVISPLLCNFCLHIIFLFFLQKTINLSCLFCPSPTLPVQALHRSWTSSGPWMAHCYVRSSVAVWADATSSRKHRSLHKAASSHRTRGRKLHPVNTQTLCAQLSFSSLEHHWRSIAYPDLVWVRIGSGQRGMWPRGARPWPRRRDHARTAGLWTSYPCAPGVNSLVAARVNQQ